MDRAAKFAAAFIAFVISFGAAWWMVDKLFSPKEEGPGLAEVQKHVGELPNYSLPDDAPPPVESGGK